MKRISLIIAIVVAAFVPTFAQNNPMLFRSPAMNATHIVFDYAGDLWKVPRAGGSAERLTSAVGNEGGARFSPDGKWIAFAGQYDGNTDVFVIPVEGGEPRRITYHPGNDGPIGWTNDGKSIVFVSSRLQTLPVGVPRMYTISVDGKGIPEELPFPMVGGSASYSPDGTKIAYMPLAPAFNQWKMYRGGRTTKVWIGSLADSAVEEIPRQNSNDFTPMWMGNKIYFLSDRNGRNVTIYSYDTSSKQIREEIRNRGLDIKAATAGPGGIVYEQFGAINIFDSKSRRSQKVNITVRGDFPQVRPKYVRVARRVANVAISPKGKRAVFEARGEILTVPVKKGNARNLTNTSGVAERDPAWSPDGKWIAYFSDESGEYALHLKEQSGLGETKKISLGNPSSYFYSPQFSPDSKKLMFRDKRLSIWYLTIATGALTKVDTNTYENPFPVMQPRWAPDSGWIVYTKQLRNRLGAVHVYSLKTKQAKILTDGIGDVRFADFDKSGKHIFFTASTNSGPTTGWLDMSSFPFQTTRSVYAIVLSAKDSSPLAPESDEEKVKEPEAKKPADKKPADKPPAAKDPAAKDPAAKDPAAKDPGKPKKPEKKEKKTVIDFDGIGQRIVALPLPARNYAALIAGTPGTFFLAEAVPPSGTSPRQQPGAVIHKFDFKTRKATKVLTGVTAFDITPDGGNMLYGQAGGKFTIVPTNRPVKPGTGVLNVAQMEVYVEPRKEWEQMYKEAWRIQRDFFYDPGFHGNDLKALEAKYKPFLAGIASRNDLNYLFREMLGNLTVGHHNAGGGDNPTARRYTVGLLGADYKIENGRYRISYIYNGENWNPGLRAPLTQPGLNVKVGEYLIAVNGRNVTSNDNLYSFFEQTAGKQIVISVGPKSDGSDARKITVVPVANEQGLRRLAWVEGNRRKVDDLSGGRLAYVYLPNTGGAGYTNFNRYYFAQIDKQGAIIDERFNGGGTAADYIVDYMRRPLMNYWSTREGEDFTTPVGSIYGPKTMIINEYAGSGGDLLPWLFREAKVGKLVGTRTWGGLVGIYNYPQLIDGGAVTAPRVAFRNLDGELDVENKGIAPDVEIDLDPKLWRQGRDAQLEKAVDITLKDLEANPLKALKKGPFPKYPTP